MAIDHELYKLRIKDLSGRMDHPFTYNDANAPKAEHWHRIKATKPYQQPEPGRPGINRLRHG
jgi:hypothetical protein